MFELLFGWEEGVGRYPTCVQCQLLYSTTMYHDCMIVVQVYMLRTICNFLKFQNCAVQIRNYVIANIPISKWESNFEIALHNFIISIQTKERPCAGGTNMDYQQQHFKTICKEHYPNLNEQSDLKR